eukprot:11977158-Prorocentrum_lima.AAC.1
MTSSLVGSEMCIRDRFNRGVRQLQAGSESGPGDVLGWLADVWGSVSVTCLLYTSDAADDM